MPNLIKLPTWTKEKCLRAVVETPRGSRAKLNYDPKHKVFRLSKSLLAGLTYPYDWGLIPSTRASDGDPLDVMIIHEAATTAGLVVECVVIGILKVDQTKKNKTIRNDRIFCVPANSHRSRELSHVDDLSKSFKKEMEKFFVATDALENKTLKFLGWDGPKAARAIVKKYQVK